MSDSSTKHHENFGPTLAALLEHKEWLRRLARGLVFDASQADDVVQQVFLSALKYRPSTDRDMRPWLKVVAVAVAKKISRSEVRRTRREKKVARVDILPLEERIAQLEAGDTYRQLGEFLKNLEEPYRTILLLHYFEGIPIDEVGKRMGLSRSTVRNRYKRGIELLRARLDSRYGDRTAWGLLLLPIVSPEASSSSAPLVRKAGWKSSFGVAALVLLAPAGFLLTAALTASNDVPSESSSAVGSTRLQEEGAYSGDARRPIGSNATAVPADDVDRADRGQSSQEAGKSNLAVDPQPSVSWKYEIDPETGIPTGNRVPGGAKSIFGPTEENSPTPDEGGDSPKTKKTAGKIKHRTIGAGISKSQ